MSSLARRRYARYGGRRAAPWCWVLVVVVLGGSLVGFNHARAAAALPVTYILAAGVRPRGAGSGRLDT